MDYVELKLCKKCDTLKPLDLEHFYACKNAKNGFKSSCKSCDREAHKEYLEQNRDKVNAKKIEWHLKNKDRLNKKSLDYWNDNKERLTTQRKEVYYPANREVIIQKRIAYQKKVKEENPEKIKGYSKKYRELHKKPKKFDIYIEGILIKECTKCGIKKPATIEYFFKAPSGRYGLFGHCKECQKQINKTEEVLNYRREFYQKYRKNQKQ